MRPVSIFVIDLLELVSGEIKVGILQNQNVWLASDGGNVLEWGIEQVLDVEVEVVVEIPKTIVNPDVVGIYLQIVVNLAILQLKLQSCLVGEVAEGYHVLGGIDIHNPVGVRRNLFQ